MDIMDKLIISWKNNFLKVYFYKKNSSLSCNEVQKKKELWILSKLFVNKVQWSSLSLTCLISACIIIPHPPTDWHKERSE